MFNAIRSAIASAIAPKTTIAPAPAKAPFPVTHVSPIPSARSSKASTASDQLMGHVTLEVIQGLSSQYLQRSLMGKLVYGAVARCFQAYQKVHARKVASPELVAAYEQALNNAAEAVAVSDMLGYSTTLDVDTFMFLATSGVPAAFKDATAAQVAGILGKTVDEVKAMQETKRRKAYDSNLEILQHVLDAVGSHQPTPTIDEESGEYQFPATACTLKAGSVISALASTTEWISGWTDPVRMATELCLIDADRKILERQMVATATADERGGNDSRHIDDQLLDASGMQAGSQSGK